MINSTHTCWRLSNGSSSLFDAIVFLKWRGWQDNHPWFVHFSLFLSLSLIVFPGKVVSFEKPLFCFSLAHFLSVDALTNGWSNSLRKNFALIHIVLIPFSMHALLMNTKSCLSDMAQGDEKTHNSKKREKKIEISFSFFFLRRWSITMRNRNHDIMLDFIRKINGQETRNEIKLGQNLLVS